MTSHRLGWRLAGTVATAAALALAGAQEAGAQRGAASDGGTARRAREGAAEASRVAASRAAALLSVDAGGRAARFVVRAGLADVAQPELNFNGATMGELELRVPVGWTVSLDFSNVGQAAHSVRVVRDRELPVTVEGAALPGAESPGAEQGTPTGGAHVVTFRASRAGRYRIACAVPAHGFAGMWLRLTVDPSLTRPSVHGFPEGAAAGRDRAALNPPG